MKTTIKVCLMMLVMALVTTVAQAQDDDDKLAQAIPRHAKVFIAPFVSESEERSAQGFETYLAAAFRKKNVPLLVVSDIEAADFVISGTAAKKGAGWAKKIFFGDLRGSASAALQVVNVKTKVVAYADSSDRQSANRGLRSSAEKLAKYLKKKIEADDKILRRLTPPATADAGK